MNTTLKPGPSGTAAAEAPKPMPLDHVHHLEHEVAVMMPRMLKTALGRPAMAKFQASLVLSACLFCAG
jgi:hypothetical protein